MSRQENFTLNDSEAVFQVYKDLRETASHQNRYVMKSYFFGILTSSRGELSGFAVVLFFLLSNKRFIFLSGKGKVKFMNAFSLG